MASRPMSFEQQFLPEGAALCVPAADHDRELQVRAGRLWLTGGERGPGDVWLGPGDRYALPAGQAVVIEGWPSASYAVATRPSRAGARPLGTWTKLASTLAARLLRLASPPPASCGSC